MIHLRIDGERENSKRRFACGLGPALPEGDMGVRIMRRHFWNAFELAFYGSMATAFLWAIATAAFGQQLKPSDFPPHGSVKLALEVTRVIDGNTVEGRLMYPWMPSGMSMRFHIADLDAWGTRKPVNGRFPEVPASEVKPGKAAARALQEVLDMGKVYAEPDVGRGSHDTQGRPVARLWVSTDDGKLIDVGAWMRERGHARPPGADKDKPDGAQRVFPARAHDLDQIARGGLGLQIPEGQGGSAGYCPLCAQSRKAQMGNTYSLRRGN